MAMVVLRHCFGIYAGAVEYSSFVDKCYVVVVIRAIRASADVYRAAAECL